MRLEGTEVNERGPLAHTAQYDRCRFESKQWFLLADCGIFNVVGYTRSKYRYHGFPTWEVVGPVMPNPTRKRNILRAFFRNE